MTLLHHLPATLWAERGGAHTAREIAQQPAVWRQLPACLDTLPATARTTLHALLNDPRALVLLTGAGTSAYAGERWPTIWTRPGRRRCGAGPAPPC
jgi:tagatose-6-phosphate ketose/aldose isomerase